MVQWYREAINFAGTNLKIDTIYIDISDEDETFDKILKKTIKFVERRLNEKVRFTFSKKLSKPTTAHEINKICGYKTLCKGLSDGGTIIIDITWSPNEIASSLAMDMGIPHIKIDVSISPALSLLDKYLDFRNSTDVSLIFDNPESSCSAVVRDNSDTDYTGNSENEYDQIEQYNQNYIIEEFNKYARFASVTHKTENVKIIGDELATLEKDNSLNVYKKYQFDKRQTFTEMVPIDYYEQAIVREVNNDNVVIIRGPTGCGKSTQIPLYILNNSKEKNEFCNMVVAQPRKIGAISTARRVCDERNWLLGSVCGYHVHLEKKTSSDTLLTYVTTEILLEQILYDKSLNRFTHIIIDDAHERNQELDFLLLVVRKFIFTNSPNTKVILMSASLEAKQLSYYFNVTASLPPPIIEVDMEYCYFNNILYIEETVKIIKEKNLTGIPKFNIEKPNIYDEVWKIFIVLVSFFDEMDAFIHFTMKEKMKGSTVVFLPDMYAIEKAEKYLVLMDQIRKQKTGTVPWEIIVLHSSSCKEEQTKVFEPIAGYRKVILSTNIAESSITIPDCYYVIDFCQTETMTMDPVTKNTSLKLEWASHVNCEQRAGRAGTLGQAIVYRLVPKSFYKKMTKRGVPQIIEAPLEKIVLQAKILDRNQSPHQILSLALNSPNYTNVKNAVLNLKEMGGLLLTCKGDKSCSDGDLSFLGTVMAALPIDVRLSKLIVLGYLFGCPEEATIVAAGCTIENIFQKKFNAYKKQLLWSDGSFSDFKTMINIFTTWKSYTRKPPYATWDVSNWCKMNLINLKQLEEWDLLITDIKNRLQRMNIKDVNRRPWYSEKSPVLDIIIAGAFYPNFFVHVPDEEFCNEHEAVKLVDGRDPTRTVYFTGMDLSQPNPLYIKAIKDMLCNEEGSATDVLVGFNSSDKIYIKFKPIEEMLQLKNGFQVVQNSRPGKVPVEVYEAVRRRQLNQIFNLKLLSQKEAHKWAIQNNDAFQNVIKNCRHSLTTFSPIPTLQTKWIHFKITQHNELGYFWAIRRECEQTVVKISKILKEQNLCPVSTTGGTIEMGKIYAVKYYIDKYYRCRIVSFDSTAALVIFVDYGNIQRVNLHDIYYLPDRDECNSAPLAFECMLHGIQPSRKLNYKGVWDEKLYTSFLRDKSDLWLYGKIQSVVDDVLYLEVFENNPSDYPERSLNQTLLVREYAEPATESFLCKENHELRRKVQQEDQSYIPAIQSNFDHIMNYQNFEAPKFTPEYKTVELKGPYSPLEVRLHGCTSNSEKMPVVIDHSSVNKVLLDTEPQNIHTRLLVAGNVIQTEQNLRLRQTSMLPGIPGLPMLVALLFCPTMRIKLAKSDTRVASILCGLGYDKPYHESHDLVLNLDTELSTDDIDKINDIRSHMNEGVKLMNEISRGRQTNITKISQYLRKNLRNLIFSSRKSINKVSAKSTNKWERNDLDVPNANESMDIWPPLSFSKR